MRSGALATLPELEEARIPLWSVRGVYSFWEVGPLQDLRLEVAVNFDQFHFIVRGLPESQSPGAGVADESGIVSYILDLRGIGNIPDPETMLLGSLVVSQIGAMAIMYPLVLGAASIAASIVNTCGNSSYSTTACEATPRPEASSAPRAT